MLSGAYMVVVDLDFFHGDPLVRNLVAPLPVNPPPDLYSIASLLQDVPDAVQVEMVSQLGSPRYIVLRPSFWRNTVPLTVCEPSGELITRVAARPGRKLHDALADSGMRLPSNCGGGGTCGLCEVTIGARAAMTEADRRLIPEVRLARGARLSCQARVSGACTVQLPFESDGAVRRTLTVTAVKCLTPFIREITLAVEGPAIAYRVAPISMS